MTLEQKYIASTSLDHRKRYAQFFTPEKIAEFMCQWVLQGKQKTRVLEPAYGLGIFSRILAQNATLPVDAYEIDGQIFASAVTARPNGVNLRNEDYFASDWNAKYDAIVCNPPYLKFHDYDNATYIPDVNNHLGTKLNGFTNLYTLFLLKSIAQLQDGGRLAYIIPSEFLNSDYGVEVKHALIESNTLHHIIVIDFTECAFDDALTTACILLCERTTGSVSVRFSLVNNIEGLNTCLSEYTEYNTSKLDANIIGSADPIRSGMIGKLYGFKSFICSNKLPAGTVGAIVGQGAIATVNRYNAPGIANAYPLTYRATDDNGLTIGFRYGTDLAKGYNYLAADMLIGAKVLIPNKVVRLVEA